MSEQHKHQHSDIPTSHLFVCGIDDKVTWMMAQLDGEMVGQVMEGVMGTCRNWRILSRLTEEKKAELLKTCSNQERSWTGCGG